MRDTTRANLVRQAGGRVSSILTRECAHPPIKGTVGAARNARQCACRAKAVEEIVDLLEHSIGGTLTQGERDVVYGRA